MMMRRLLTTLLPTAAAALVLAPGASAGVTYGISDQQASTFSNPLYAPLKLKVARYVAPYDVMFDATQLARWDAWHRAAKADGQRILVSFEHSRTAGRERKAPTKGQYSTAMKAFHKAYPDVKEINTWNEINACQSGSRTERQPLNICKPSKVGLLIDYYGVDRSVFKNATIIPIDVLDDRSTSAKTAIAYIKAFKRKSKKQPMIWGLHNYSDTNRFSQTRTTKILRAFGKGDVWLLETGGQLNVFGGSQSAKEAGAAKALKCMFYIAKHQSRVKRVYIYQFNGAPAGASFDAGLINVDNTARPGWQVVKKRSSAKC